MPYSISLRRPTEGLCGENGKLFLNEPLHPLRQPYATTVQARVTRLNKGQHRWPRSAAKPIRPGVNVNDALSHTEYIPLVVP